MSAALSAEAFASYPPEARALAAHHVPLLRSLPVPYALVLLREIRSYDFKFPAERRRLDGELLWLRGMDAPERARAMQGFATIALPGDTLRPDWPSEPVAAMEQMTAFLWSSQQMEAFRAAANTYANALRTAVPERQPAQPRLLMVVVGKGVDQAATPLFRKLRPHGVMLRRVSPEGGMAMLVAEAERRAGRSSAGENFLHWYIDGGEALPAPSLTRSSYEALRPAREALLHRTEQLILQDGMGPERLRSAFAQLRPEEIGIRPATRDANSEVLRHFELSLLTEGSGTQIFSTTFVQWAARECLRRAQPETLLLRYAPRQQQQPMNLMLTGAGSSEPDAAGSLVDADMGAFYTWLNGRRLPGAESMRFLAWFEGHPEAIVIGPGLPQGTTSDSALTMAGVLKLLG